MNTLQGSAELNSKDLPKNLNLFGWGLSALGIILFVIAFFVDQARSSYAFLIAFMFIMSVGLGSLFLVALEYLAGAVWSTPIRRVTENLGSLLFLLPLLAIPLYLNMHDLFHWTHNEAVSQDPILQQKEPYLNTNFFIVRTIVFFLLWLLFYALIIRNSRKQDKTHDPKLTRTNIKLSAVFMPIFAITITFSAIDWMMSLEPHWFSTIYGVYYFSGTVLAALAATTLIVVLLKEKGKYFTSLVKDHYYSLGALMFAFTNFWAYIAFSQYLLIWYADIPEETFWFAQRWEGNWQFVSILLIFVHFLVPYFGLLSQDAKMNPRRLLFMSIWILFAHLLDLYWLIMPTFSEGSIVFGWIEASVLILAAGLILLAFNINFKRINLLPIGDPKLKRGLEFRL